MREALLPALFLAWVAAPAVADERDCPEKVPDLQLVLKPTLPGYKAEGPTPGKCEHRAKEGARFDASTQVQVEQSSSDGGSETIVRFDLSGERHSTADLLCCGRSTRPL